MYQRGAYQSCATPGASRHVLTDGIEMRDVTSAFIKTLPANRLTVIQVERLENPTLRDMYETKKRGMMQRDRVNDTLERLWLFHGTDEGSVSKIRVQGFNRSFCGKNATMYGKGAYFAVDSAYSAQHSYSKPNSSGEQLIFLCRVLVGEYCKGKEDACIPDERQCHTLYDTTVDDVQNPTIFVTYHDAQAYPNYLVKFKLK